MTDIIQRSNRGFRPLQFDSIYKDTIMNFSNAPERLRKARQSMQGTNEFIEKYSDWLRGAGEDHCDFALGNPQEMPMKEFVSALEAAVTPRDKNWYAYKMNESASRDIVSSSLFKLTNRQYDLEDIFITNGATGALLVTMNSLIERDDEVIYMNPPWFFYEGMILNMGGTPVPVNVDPQTFDLDLAAIEKAITAKTRFVLVNSPHNPTGKIYTAATLRQLSDLLQSVSQRIGRPIYLVSDEAYRKVVYDGAEFHSATSFYANSIMIYTYGKTLLTPGQRLGYVALSPEMDDLEDMRAAIWSSQVLCGWAVASALMQHSLQDLEAVSLNISDLQRRRDKFVAGLRECGYDLHVPEGAFYLTPKSPIADDFEFVDRLAEEEVFCLPGSILTMPGYFRVSITANDQMIDRALPKFAAANK